MTHFSPHYKFSSHFSFFPHDNLLCQEFVHMTICYVENLSTWKSVMWSNFSTWQIFFHGYNPVYGPDYDECGGNQLCCKNQFINAFLFFSVAFMKQLFPEHWLALRQTSQSYFIPHRAYQNTISYVWVKIFIAPLLNLKVRNISTPLSFFFHVYFLMFFGGICRH